MSLIASVRASTRRPPNPETVDPAKVTATLPDAKLYGVYGPQYAAALAAKTGATGADILNRGTLAAMAHAEQRDYASEMAASRAEELQLQAAAAQAARERLIIQQMPDYVDRGIGEALDGYGVFGDPVAGAVIRRGDNNVLNQDEAARVRTKAEGYGILADKLGMKPSTSYLGKDFTNPNSDPAEGQVQFEENFQSPELKNKVYGTDQGLTYEQQLALAQAREAAARARGEELKASVTIGANGVAQTVYTGSPEVLRANGIDPATGQVLRPNAGAGGGAAPATQAAPQTKPAPQQKPTAGGDAVRPVSNGRAIAQHLYPQGHVTEVERPKNASYGEPDSWHKRSHAAIDMRPIKGMTFEQYVQGYKDAGYHIIEAKDEVKHPSKHATGPHWHVVLGQNRSNDVYVQRLKAHPMVQAVQQLDDGRVLVTLKDGSQRVYDRGKRVG